MKENEKEKEEPRRDLLLILLIVPLGVLCMFLTGQQAIKLAPSWTLVADMGSNLDPDVDFAAKTVPELMEPVNSDILTQPVWGNLFLTPNAVIPTRNIPTKAPTPQTLPTTQPTASIPTSLPTLVPPPTTIVLPPPQPTSPPPQPTSPPPQPTSPPPPVPSADLSILKNANNTEYTPGAGIEYTILVTNAGPDAATGFNVTDTVPADITGLTITCTPSGSCGTDNSAGQDMAFNNASLNAGQTLTITIQGVVDTGTTGNLSNTANLVIPGGANFNDPDITNNSDLETNAQAAGWPNFGPPDGTYFSPGDGASVTYLLPTPITSSGDATPDFVYFEYMYAPNQVLMDWVQVEISADGSTWFTVFFWGDGASDANTNVAGISPEDDNYAFSPADATLYASPGAPTIYSGVTIDIDAITGSPAGTTYSWIRITAPEIPPGSGNYGDADGLTLDSIQPYYP